MYTTTQPTLLPHNTYGERLFTLGSRGMFSFEQTTTITGISKMACIKAWSEPEVYPGVLGNKIFADPYFLNNHNDVVYDHHSDRVYFSTDYCDQDLNNHVVRIHRMNCRTGVVENVITYPRPTPQTNSFYSLVVSQNRVFVVLSNIVDGINSFKIVILDKTLTTINTLTYLNPTTAGFSTVILAAMSDTELLIQGNSTGQVHYVTINEATPSTTVVRSHSPGVQQNRAYIRASQLLFVSTTSTRIDTNYIGQLWNPLTGSLTNVGLLNAGMSGGDFLTVRFVPGSRLTAPDYGLIDGHKVLLRCGYNKNIPAASTEGAVEVNTQTGEIKYYGFYLYQNGSELNNTFRTDIGTVTKLIYPNWQNNVSNNTRTVDSFMYGMGDTVIAFATYDDIPRRLLNPQAYTSRMSRLLVWERSGGRAGLLTLDHYMDATKDIIIYDEGARLVVPSLFIFNNEWNKLIKLPAIAPYGADMSFNTTPPVATPITRNGDRYFSPDLNIPQDQVTWVSIQHDGMQDVKITYDSVEDRTIFSQDPLANGLMQWMAQVIIYDSSGEMIGTTGSQAQVPSAFDWENSPATLPAAYPAGTYYIALLPALKVLQTGLYTDRGFYASSAGTYGPSNMRLRFEHLRPAYNQVTPLNQVAPAPLTTQPLLDGGVFMYQLSSGMSLTTPLAWATGVTKYFRVLTNPLNKRFEPVTLVSFTNNGSNTIGDFCASVESQLPGFSMYVSVTGRLTLYRPNATFTILDGQTNGDVVNHVWGASGALSVTYPSGTILTSMSQPVSIAIAPFDPQLVAGTPSSSGTIPYATSNTSNATQNTIDYIVTLTAGQALVFGTTLDLPGTSSVPGDDDTYIRVRNPSGWEVASNDDFSSALSKVFHKAKVSGDYTLVIGGYDDSQVTGVAAWEIHG